MKVRMLTSMSGPTIDLANGDAHECAADEAKRLIDAGFAEAWVDAAPVETADAPHIGKETRTRSRARNG